MGAQNQANVRLGVGFFDFQFLICNSENWRKRQKNKSIKTTSARAVLTSGEQPRVERQNAKNNNRRHQE